MHSFLPSIGFTNIKNRQQLEPIYRQILESPDRKFISTISADTCLVQFSKDFGERFGISLVGEMSKDGSISIEYYFPYVTSKLLTDDENIYVEKYSDKRAQNCRSFGRRYYISSGYGSAGQNLVNQILWKNF